MFLALIIRFKLLCSNIFLRIIHIYNIKWKQCRMIQNTLVLWNCTHFGLLSKQPCLDAFSIDLEFQRCWIDGGLGFRGLKQRYIALIIKLDWRYSSEHHSIWREVMACILGPSLYDLHAAWWSNLVLQISGLGFLKYERKWILLLLSFWYKNSLLAFPLRI